MCKGAHRGQKRVLDFLAVGVTRGYKLPVVGAGNQTQALWKSNTKAFPFGPGRGQHSVFPEVLKHWHQHVGGSGSNWVTTAISVKSDVFY